MAVRVIAVTRRDAITTMQAAYPADGVRLTYAIDMRALELLNRLKDRLAPDSAAWQDVEELERAIDSGLNAAIPIEDAREHEWSPRE